MSVPVLLYGALGAHRRGKILQESLLAEPSCELPDGCAVALAFADAYQGAPLSEQSRLLEWTRVSGHLLLLLPPFATGACERPVSWRAERLERAPQGGEGLATMLAPEVTYRLEGKLQTPAVPGATWSDLSVCIGTYRSHPAAGLFAVTTLPLWSLSVLDAPNEVERWLATLIALAGKSVPATHSVERALHPDHYGMLVFLLSEPFENEAQAIAALSSSPIFRFSPEKGRSLLQELRDRGGVIGAAPTPAALELVMQSPYAPYVSAVREVSR